MSPTVKLNLPLGRSPSWFSLTESIQSIHSSKFIYLLKFVKISVLSWLSSLIHFSKSISERHPTLGGFEDLLERQKRTMMKNYRVHVNNVVSTVREFIRELRNNYSSYQEIPINQYQIYFIDFTSIVNSLLKNRTPYTVPPHQLLIWNVKDGWEPLCAFLGKPVPDKPFPFENATGDKTKKNEFVHQFVPIGYLRSIW